ncbi:hypothetical protein E2C01_008831 [Portunus trituberculatus]|uniref:Uncharacterized protein n=1 Tax=Portunus trituberculatus TaxID=210409 RepID=A0A5B7D1U8_PORTR|nr:hypothetical protein [Portunus trituberculatus]
MRYIPLVSGPYEAPQALQHYAGAPRGPEETRFVMAGVSCHPTALWLATPLYPAPVRAAYSSLCIPHLTEGSCYVESNHQDIQANIQGILSVAGEEEKEIRGNLASSKT